MYCVKCGREIANELSFCPYCGAKTNSKNTRDSLNDFLSEYEFTQTPTVDELSKISQIEDLPQTTPVDPAANSDSSDTTPKTDAVPEKKDLSTSESGKEKDWWDDTYEMSEEEVAAINNSIRQGVSSGYGGSVYYYRQQSSENERRDNLTSGRYYSQSNSVSSSAPSSNSTIKYVAIVLVAAVVICSFLIIFLNMERDEINLEFDEEYKLNQSCAFFAKNIDEGEICEFEINDITGNKVGEIYHVSFRLTNEKPNVKLTLVPGDYSIEIKCSDISVTHKVTTQEDSNENSVHIDAKNLKKSPQITYEEIETAKKLASDNSAPEVKAVSVRKYYDYFEL